MLGEGEPSFKEFLASPAKCVLGKFLGVSCFSRNDAFGLMSIKPDVGRTKSFPACYFSVAMPLRFFRLFLSCFIELSL